MSILSKYLIKRFFIQSFSLFIVASLLVWITQILRLFDLITVKGQDLFTLIGQSFLTTPQLAMAIFSICLAIGLARALYAMQENYELHSIHSLNMVKQLWQAIMIFALGGLIFQAIIANYLNPISQKSYARWNQEIAADILGRALIPDRFSEIVPSLVVVIGGRSDDGFILDFFANDRRNKERETTYISKKAEIIYDDYGYNVSLIDGTVQFFDVENNELSQLSFNRYSISLERLGKGDIILRNKQLDSYDLIRNSINADNFSSAIIRELNSRFSETLRPIAIILLVGALAAFPTAKRKRSFVPLEAVILLIGLGERAISAIMERYFLAGSYVGSIILFIFSLIIIFYKGSFFSLKNKKLVEPT